MKSIGEFFSRIQNRHAQEVFLRTIVQQVLSKVANIDVDISGISFKGAAVILKNVSPATKAHAYLKKQAILKEIAIQSPGRAITDIKFF